MTQKCSKVVIDLVAPFASFATVDVFCQMFPECTYLERLLMRMGELCTDSCLLQGERPPIPGYPVGKVIVVEGDGWKCKQLPKTRHLCLCQASDRESERLIVELQPEHVCCNWLLTPMIPESAFLNHVEFAIPDEGVTLEWIDGCISMGFKHWKHERPILCTKVFTQSVMIKNKQKMLFELIQCAGEQRLLEIEMKLITFSLQYGENDLTDRLVDFCENVAVNWVKQ